MKLYNYIDLAFFAAIVWGWGGTTRLIYYFILYASYSAFFNGNAQKWVNIIEWHKDNE